MATVTKVYGDALMAAALEGNETDRLYEEARALQEIWRENPELSAFLENPNVADGEKLSVLKSVFAERVSPDMMGFLITVQEKGRQKEIPQILDAFIHQVMEYKKIGTAWVTSAVSLTEEQKAQVRDKLLATTSYVEFEMHFAVDPSLIGGMVLRIGDRVVDSSIRTRLHRLEKELLGLQLD